jgi:hypothetical protein
MVPALGRDDFLLDQSQKPSAFRQGQAQSCDVARITRADNLQHVDTSAWLLFPSLHQAQYHAVLIP